MLTRYLFRKVISLNVFVSFHDVGVFGGSIQEMQLYAAGLLIGFPRAVVNPLKLRIGQRTSTSNLFMLPGQYFWPDNKTVVRTKLRSYTIGQIDEFLKDIGLPQAVSMRQHIVNSTYLMNTDPGVPLHCFYGNIKESVVETLEYDGKFPDKPSKFIMGDGDGTVNDVSLRLCRNLVQKNVGSGGSVSVISDVDHNGVLSNGKVFAGISKLLS